MGPQSIERMDERMNALEAALEAHFAERVVKRSYYKNYKHHGEAELEQGVLILMSDGEGEYSEGLGMRARKGTHEILLIGHLKADKHSEPVDTEKAEIALIEEIKAFVRAGVEGMDIDIETARHSRQQQHPYGWVVVALRAGPLRSTT